MKKIIFVMNTIGEGSGPLQRAIGISKKGYDIYVVSFLSYCKVAGRDLYINEYENLVNKYSSFNLNFVCISASNFKDSLGYIRLYKLIKKINPVCIFCHHNVMGSVGVLFSKIIGIKNIFKVQLSALDRRSLPLRVLDFLSFIFVKEIICISKSTMETFPKIENFFFRKKLSYIYNGINVTHSNISNGLFREKYKLASNEIIISTVGRLHPVKDYALLFDVLAIVVNALKNRCVIKFVIAGRGKLEDELKGKAKKLGIENNVIFCGHIKRDNVYELLVDSDIYVMASRSEGFSEALLQAMISKNPSVLVDIPAFREAVRDGVEGFIVNRLNKCEFADEIISLAESKELRERMGNAAKDRVLQNYAIENVIEEYIRRIDLC